MLTHYTEKENDSKEEFGVNTIKLRDKYKMLSKITLTKFELQGQK